MKITSVEIIPFDQPYKGNLIFSAGGKGNAGTKAVGNFILIKIKTDEGFEGIGSSIGFYPTPQLNKGCSRDGAMVLLRDLATLLIGEDPLRTSYLLDKMENAMGGWFLENWWVLSFLDCALYDLKGKILGVPVYDLLGGIQREEIPLEWIQSFHGDPAAQAEEAKRYVDAGFKSVKVHVNAVPGMAVKRMKAVREAVGPDIPIGVDMGCSFDAHDALRTIEALDEYNLNFAEQPLPVFDYDGLVSLRSKTHVPIVADTSAFSVDQFYQLIKINAVDSAHCLICRVGGLRRAQKWADLADVAHIDYQICNLANTVANAAAAHFAVSRRKRGKFNDELGIFLYLHGTTDTDSITDDIVVDPSAAGRIANGTLYAPGRKPGLGVELDEAQFAKYVSQSVGTIVVD